MAKHAHPMVTERQQLFESMDENLKALAVRIQENSTKGILATWAVGRLFGKANNEAEYGEGAVGKLAAVTDYSVSYVYELIRFSSCFDKATIDQLGSQAKENNSAIDLRHFLLASRIADYQQRVELLLQAIKYGWSSRQFEAHIKAQGYISSGRAKVSTFSPVQGLQKLTDNALRLDQYVNSKGQEVLDLVESSSDDELSDVLLQKFDIAHTMVSDTIASLSKTQERMAKLQDVIAKRQRISAADTDTDDASEETDSAAAEQDKPKQAGRARKPAGKPAGKSAGKSTGKPAAAGKQGGAATKPGNKTGAPKQATRKPAAAGKRSGR